MTKTFTVSLLLLFVLAKSTMYAQNSNLKVEVTGFENQKSTTIFVSVFSKEDFLETSIETKSAQITGDKVIVDFDLPPGEYAVSTYHDVNSNGKLDRRFYGKPKEPYGFSQNVRPFGKPSFKRCKFSIDTPSKEISIKLIR